jgi:hypothetical protein
MGVRGEADTPCGRCGILDVGVLCLLLCDNGSHVEIHSRFCSQLCADTTCCAVLCCVQLARQSGPAGAPPRFTTTTGVYSPSVAQYLLCLCALNQSTLHMLLRRSKLMPDHANSPLQQMCQNHVSVRRQARQHKQWLVCCRVDLSNGVWFVQIRLGS